MKKQAPRNTRLGRHSCPPNTIYDVFEQLCVDANSTYAALCLRAFKVGGLAELETVRALFSPSAYSHPRDFAVDYLVHTYLSKLDDPKEVDRLKEECLAGLQETEKRNAQWNRKLRTILPSLAAEALIDRVRRKIRRVIGSAPPLGEVFSGCGWGPGATYSLASVDSTLDKKILEPQLSITARAVPYFLAYASLNPHWFYARTGIFPEGNVTWLPSEFNVVKGERFSTAPKKWNGLRTISIQPTGNLLLQKGVGAYIRKQLKKIGIDLDDQSRNQLAAQKAYKLGLATLDIKDASNSLISELVRLYLDEDWVNLLEDLRSPWIEISPGNWQKLEYHAAMGNGYTFELESLLFWAIAQCCCEEVEEHEYETDVSQARKPFLRALVYGDDIIVPQEAAALTVEVLEANGFRINTQKSYLKGNFYESCGEHFFQGVRVTPIYEKKMGLGLDVWVRSYNRLYRWCYEHNAFGRFSKTLALIRATGEWCVRVLNERRTRPGRGMYRSGGRSKSSYLLPTQAIWMPGDGGFIVPEADLPISHRSGIYRLIHYVARPLHVQLEHGDSLYADWHRCEAARWRGEVKDPVINHSSWSVPVEWAVLNYLTGNDLLKVDVEEIPQSRRDRVTPRGALKWSFGDRRFYDWQRSLLPKTSGIDVDGSPA